MQKGYSVVSLNPLQISETVTPTDPELVARQAGGVYQALISLFVEREVTRGNISIRLDAEAKVVVETPSADSNGDHSNLQQLPSTSTPRQASLTSTPREQVEMVGLSSEGLSPCVCVFFLVLFNSIIHPPP